MTDALTMKRVHDIGYQMLEWFDTICKKYDIQYWISYGVLLGAVRHNAFVPWDDDIDVWMTRKEYERLMRHRDEFPDEYEVMLPDSYGDNRYYDTVTHINYKGMYREIDSDIWDFYNHIFPRGMHIDIFFLENTYKGFRGKKQIIETMIVYGLMNSYRHRGIRIEDYSLLWKVAQCILSFVGRHIALERLFKWHERIATRYNGRTDTEYYYSSNAGLHVGDRLPGSVLQKKRRIPFGPLMVQVPEESDAILKILYGNWRELPPREEQKLPEGFVFLKDESCGGGYRT